VLTGCLIPDTSKHCTPSQLRGGAAACTGNHGWARAGRTAARGGGSRPQAPWMARNGFSYIIEGQLEVRVLIRGDQLYVRYAQERFSIGHKAT
jgi:hypothetical protein